jgi:two-component system nitrogen regulation sensor histidine kinase NtrY
VRWRGGLLVRAWTPVGDSGLRLVMGDMIQRELLAHLDQAIAADATFQEMKMQRGIVTSTTILVFLAITLVLLFATVWIGLYLSRRFTEPLLAVAAATQRVAEGNQLEEVSTPATDEVLVLVHSFNSMVRRVRSTEEEILASNQELATLLATIPTGVLTLSSDGRRFRPNPAGAAMLGEPLWAGSWRSLDQLRRPGLEGLHERLLPGQPDDCQFQVDIDSEGRARHMDVTITPLPGGGAVVAMDDLTQLVRAQRQAAWSEVARRIAHEIRNPLTPIRLAAERIQRRAQSLGGELQEIISTGCEAIVAHVSGLKELVDSFYKYARMPTVEPQATAVGKLVREVTSLYENLRPGLDLRLDLPTRQLVAMVDAVLLRQALVNLIDNAVEAISGDGDIAVRAFAAGRDLVVEVEDTGSGLPTEDPEVLTQPFFSTKGRGSGMGLALVHRIIIDHGGSLEIGNRGAGGAWVRITLPQAVVEPEQAVSELGDR